MLLHALGLLELLLPLLLLELLLLLLLLLHTLLLLELLLHQHCEGCLLLQGAWCGNCEVWGRSMPLMLPLTDSCEGRAMLLALDMPLLFPALLLLLLLLHILLLPELLMLLLLL